MNLEDQWCLKPRKGEEWGGLGGRERAFQRKWKACAKVSWKEST